MQSLRKKLLNEASLHGSCTLIYQMDIFCNGFNQSLRADSASPMNHLRRPEGIRPTWGYGYDHNRLNQQHLPHTSWLPDSWNKDCFIPNLNKEYNRLTVVVIPKERKKTNRKIHNHLKVMMLTRHFLCQCAPASQFPSEIWFEGSWSALRWGIDLMKKSSPSKQLMKFPALRVPYSHLYLYAGKMVVFTTTTTIVNLSQ